MYLTSILVPPSMNPMDERSLVQLVNRVGRVPGRATIYTPAHYVDIVRNAINIDEKDMGNDPVQISTLRYMLDAIRGKFRS